MRSGRWSPAPIFFTVIAGLVVWAVIGVVQVSTTGSSARAAAERAKALRLPIPAIQGQYQVLLLEAGDRHVTIRTYCYQGTTLFTNEKGELLGVAAGGCAWKSH